MPDQGVASWVEFHDSIVAAVDYVAADVEIVAPRTWLALRPTATVQSVAYKPRIRVIRGF